MWRITDFKMVFSEIDPKCAHMACLLFVLKKYIQLIDKFCSMYFLYRTEKAAQ